MSVVSVPSIVEAPYIIAKIGGVEIGKFGKNEFPNYMNSINISKINGTLNTYTLNLSHQVQAGEDPNYLDKIFSSVASDRIIYLSYGDYSEPSTIFSEEKCIITGVSSQVDVASARINYTVKCISDAISLTNKSYSFGSTTAKGSDVLKDLLFNPSYGLQKVFTGMVNKNEVLSRNDIVSDDKVVKIPAAKNVTLISYMNTVAQVMEPIIPGPAKYILSFQDNVEKFGGTIFKVANTVSSPINSYTIDVGYPGDNMVMDFRLNNEMDWAMFYESGSAWWRKMTEFPISGTLTIKGLVKPVMLVSKIKLNVYFYGKKHITSGEYIVTAQNDTLDGNGYRTSLNLLRVGGD